MTNFFHSCNQLVLIIVLKCFVYQKPAREIPVWTVLGGEKLNTQWTRDSMGMFPEH